MCTWAVFPPLGALAPLSRYAGCLRLSWVLCSIFAVAQPWGYANAVPTFTISFVCQHPPTMPAPAPDPAPANAFKQYTREQVAQHNQAGDVWIIIDATIYNVSSFAELHPGGESVFYSQDIAGDDATDTFFGLHRREILDKPMAKRLIAGKIVDEEPQIQMKELGAPSPIPFAEPTWLHPVFKTPYYQDSHYRLQREFRAYVETNVIGVARECEANGKRPPIELIQDMGARGINAMRMGPGKLLKGRKLFADINPEEFDYFHELILTQELCRAGVRGFIDGLQGGMVIGLPPIINFGSPELQAEIIEPVLSGKKFIALAVSEAFAGSDVFGIRTTARRQEDGSFVVCGTKKWITNGHFADYFTTLCKFVDEEGEDEGFGVICIPRQDGVESKQIKTQYSTTAGTGFITFDSLHVPRKYVVGTGEGGMEGIKVVLSNFNHERWAMCCGTIRGARLLLEECLTWTSQRKAFGKPLTAQAVVRQKLGKLMSDAEAGQAWLEAITFQMNQMTYNEQSKYLAGHLALLKSWATEISTASANEAINLFGGRGLTKTGLGALVSAAQIGTKFDAILGGTEEILRDLGVRQALRFMPKDYKM